MPNHFDGGAGVGFTDKAAIPLLQDEDIHPHSKRFVGKLICVATCHARSGLFYNESRVRNILDILLVQMLGPLAMESIRATIQL